MSQENVERVRAALAAYNRDGPEAIIALFAPDVEWIADRSDMGRVTSRGVDGVRKSFEQMYEGFDRLGFEVDELIQQGNRLLLSAGCLLVAALPEWKRRFHWPSSSQRAKTGSSFDTSPSATRKKPSKPWGCQSKTRCLRGISGYAERLWLTTSTLWPSGSSTNAP